MKIALAAAATMLVGAPAMATVTTYVQGFDDYTSPWIDQYSGPLNLVGVSIDWSVWASITGWTLQDEQTIHSAVMGYGWFTDGTNYAGALPTLTSDTVTTTCYYRETCGAYVSVDGHIDLPSRDIALFVGTGQVQFEGPSQYIGDLPTDYDPFNAIWSGVGGGVTYYLSDVPEPVTWAMMLLGFGAIGLGARRRAKVRLTYA